MNPAVIGCYAATANKQDAKKFLRAPYLQARYARSHSGLQRCIRKHAQVRNSSQRPMSLID